jgi:hypothetical protein
VPEKHVATLDKLRPASGFHQIGVIEAEPGLRIVDEAGGPYQPRQSGHDHFAD